MKATAAFSKRSYSGSGERRMRQAAQQATSSDRMMPITSPLIAAPRPVPMSRGYGRDSMTAMRFPPVCDDGQPPVEEA